MSNVTPEIVRGVWDHLSDHYGTRVIYKGNAKEMRVLGWFLGQIGVLDPEEFVSRFSTTIGTHVYTAFEVGVPTDRHPLWSQVVLCAHEHQHVQQLRDHGTWTLASTYLGSRAKRAAYEAEAYTCNLELNYWRTGRIQNLDALAHFLESYDCGPEDIEATYQTLVAAARTIRAGGIITEAGRRAIQWLETHAPELKYAGAS